MQSVANGDTIGAFRDLAGPLGLDAGIAGAIGGALGAIKGGDIASLTNALGGLGGAAPQILGDVLGARLPLSGIDIGGFGAQGGLDFDLALASTFMSTAAAFLECDPPDECPPTDTQTLSSGGESQDDSKSGKVNNANIIDKVKATNIPSGDDLKPGSFGISPEGAQEALNNSLSSVGDKGSFDTSALTGGIIPESIEGFTERNINNLTDGNIIPESVGSFDTSSYLPENSFKVTPKKKFNVPKGGGSVVYNKRTKSDTGKSNTTVKLKKGGVLDSLTKEQITDAYAELHKRYVNNEKLSREEKINYEIRYPDIMWAKYGVSSSGIQSVLGGGDTFDPYVRERFGK